ncbi:uncharacterized protein OCT59_021814 [Rhizophagus irregularis]|uniref:uncharacterized protein n=1 Tax=Rhizophagus irregularis TaxID=588596 RepID=UPI00332C136C|nr:hypothetical protein OCT59_021814 [Rhizophagus irregularis]
METYEITFEEKTPLYYSSQEIFSEETEEDLDTSFDELSELEIFEFNEKNYINAQNALEQEVVEYSSDENEEEFGTYEDQEVPPPPVEDANEPIINCQTKNVRNLCQLVGVWQIDENAVSEYQSKGIPLGVCMSHFNYDQKNHNAFIKQLRNPEQSEISRRRCLLCSKNFHFFSRGIGCKDHLWKMWGKYIQIPCVGLYTCNAVHECQGISQRIFDDVSTIRYICYNCYESYGGHLNRRPGSGKRKTTCEQHKLHKEDTSKSLKLLAQWLTYVADTETEEKKEIILASMLVPALKFLYTPSETPLKYEYYNSKDNTRYLNLDEFNNTNNIDDSIKFLIEILPKLPSYFFLKLLLNINRITDITQPKLDWTDDKWKEIGEKLGNEVWNSRKIVTDKKSEIQLPISLNAYYESFPNFLRDVEHITKCVTFFASLIISMAFPYLGVWFTQVMASMSRKSRLFFSFRQLLSTLHISGHTDSNERRIEKQRMDKVNPTERLIKGPNIWNLAVIDNIDFKEKSFTYGNIFDTTRKSSHTTLRMAFQMRMPIPLEERADDKKNITSPTGLFGMNDLMKDTWDKFDDIIDNLLNFQTSSEGQLLYNTDFDMAAIHQKILENVDHGCLADAPNIVILETGGIPNSDEGIFQSTEMYKQDFNLGPDDYLDVVADEAIFRRLIKQRKIWPKLRPILGQWHTSKDMCGVLIVLFSSYGIFDLAKVSGVKFLDKLDKIVDYRSTVRVLELIWCAVTISIRIYMKKTNLNKYNIMDSNSGANNILRIWYLYYKWASIFKAHRVGIRVGNYKLQKNALSCFAGLFTSAGKSNYSSSVTQYLGMLAQYPKLEEKLECVSSVKIDNDEKRKGHYFAFDESLETFGVKFIKQNITGNVVDDNKLKLQVKAAQSERDRIGILLSEYLNDPCGSIGQRAVDTVKRPCGNYTTTPDHITADSIRRLENCFPDGILRIEEIFLQDVISIQKSNKVGRRKLGITRWKPNDQNSKKNKNKMASSSNTENSISDQQVPTNLIPQVVIIDKDGPLIKKPRQARRETKPEEKSLLEPLVTCSEYPNDEQIEQVRELLGNEWDKDRIYQYISRHRRNKNNKHK